ncbi:MAG: RHS repeat-associated core domain-containing protein [Acidobacteriota bacterium]
MIKQSVRKNHKISWLFTVVRHGRRSTVMSLLSLLLIMLQLVTVVPVHAWSTSGLGVDKESLIKLLIPAPSTSFPADPAPVTLPPAPIMVWPTFSTPPTAEEIAHARIFEESLTTVNGNPSVTENQALAKALLTYSHNVENGDPEDTVALEQFLTQYPRSAWSVSLLTNLGLVYRRTGYFLKALDAWEQAWKLGKQVTDIDARDIVDRAVAELAELNARLGRYDRLEALFAELDKRELRGSAAEKVVFAREGLWLMNNEPGNAFRCGPMALDRIRAYESADKSYHPLILAARSTRKGMSLAEIAHLSDKLKMNLQSAKWITPAQVPVPAVIHWKANHFAALVASIEQNGKKYYLVQDPTFGNDSLVSEQALTAEASGYFLIPQGTLSAGWQTVSEAEANNVWGKGNTGSSDPESLTCGDDKIHSQGCCSSQGMASYDVHSMLVSLNITDTPIGYSPPRGPAINFTLTYNQRDSFQPVTIPYSNFGKKWTFNWLSYVTDNNSATAPFTVTLYARGGGQETYSLIPGTNTYKTHIKSRATLIWLSATSYERRLSDGSKEIYSQPDGATTYPRKVFLTQVIDPMSNSVSLTYEKPPTQPGWRIKTFRTDSITPAQVTTLHYEMASDQNKITKITDPFGRSATFQYDSPLRRLIKIIDPVGIVSQFGYDGGTDFINSLTTPYGTTTFVKSESGTTRSLQITDPLGDTEKIEYRHQAPGILPGDPPDTVPTGMGLNISNTFLHYRNTFYWDKKAFVDFPNDYTKAYRIHWLHKDSNTTAGIKESKKAALENRVWYNYQGQTNPNYIGTNAKPTKVARVLVNNADPALRITQLYQYDYNDLGKVLFAIDPEGRRTSYTYAANKIDLLEVRQTTGSNNELLVSYTYNPNHLPLTTTDAAGKPTTFTYNTQGQVLTVTNAKNEITTYSYDSSGRLIQIIGPVTGATTTYGYDPIFTYRVKTVTDSENYTVTTDYDALDRVVKVTYPDATFEQINYVRTSDNKMILDPTQMTDRLGRTTRKLYDGLRRVVSITDPLQRTTTFSYCNCGGLYQMVDALGQRTTWNRDLQGRVISKVLDDSQQTTTYVYESTTSRLKQMTDAKNQITNYEYFKDNNLKQVSYTNAQITTPTVSYTYDTNYNRIVSMQDGTGITTYTYHPVTVPPQIGATKLASIDGPLTNDIISYSYDELERVTSRSINNVAMTMQYDALGRVTNVNNALGVFTHTYVGTTGRLNTMNYPNGQQSIFTYFSNVGDHRVQTITNKKSDQSVISSFSYTYDAEGQILTWQQPNRPLPDDLTYDDAGQLIRNTYNLGGVQSTNYIYGYDNAGNRSSEQIGNNTSSWNYDTTNRVQSQTNPSKIFTHNLNGNMTSDGTRIFEWDAANRLVAVTNGTLRSEFTYDGMSRRVRIVEKNNGVVTSDNRFLWCDGEICEERDASGSTVTKRYFLQGVQEGMSAYFYTKDHLGSIRELTDSSQTIRAQYSYDPFGRITKLNGDKDADFRYTGHYYHVTSVLQLTRYRAYDANLGRWISRDPIKEGDGLNLYAYVHNTPINSDDPYGLQGSYPLPLYPPGSNVSPSLEKAIQNSLFEALGRLTRPRCAQFFAQNGGDGFTKLRNARFRIISRTSNIGAEAKRDITPYEIWINPNGAFANLNNPVINVGGRQFIGDCGSGLRGPQLGALLLLHELGHLMNIFGPDADSPDINRAYTQAVLRNCFDCTGCFYPE